MKKLLCLFLILASASLALAAGSGPVYKVGSWNEYKYYNDDNTTGSMKVSVVGQEGNAFWVEHVTSGVMGGKSGEKTIMKMLVEQSKDKSSVKRMIVQNGKEAPKELPENMMKMMGGGKGSSMIEDMKNIKEFYSKGKKDSVEITEKDNVTVKVPAGTFKAKYLKIVDKESKRTIEIYSSESVTPAGIVKSTENGKVRMELIKASAKGAKSEISGKIETIKMPNMDDLMKMNVPDDASMNEE